LLEQVALDRGADRIVNRDAAAQLARFADHALPRQLIGRLARLHRGARDACTAGNAGELGDLAIRGDGAFGNLADDLIDAPIQRAKVVALFTHN
jgi:hypothetical protein